MILGIDTSGGQCAVALIRADGVVLAKMTEPMERSHAERLFPMIEEAMAVARAGFGDLARIGVCTGPGSFTGIRVGIAAARGIALGRGIPAVGVSRFEALAADSGAGTAMTVVVPGQGGKSFVQDFGADGQARARPRLASAGLRLPVGHVLVGAGGRCEQALADPVVIARLAAESQSVMRAAPLYLRDAGAAPPREAPPPLLDP